MIGIPLSTSYVTAVRKSLSFASRALKMTSIADTCLFISLLDCIWSPWAQGPPSSWRELAYIRIHHARHRYLVHHICGHTVNGATSTGNNDRTISRDDQRISKGMSLALQWLPTADPGPAFMAFANSILAYRTRRQSP